MPNLTHDQAIKEYWETIKDKYPQLDLPMCMDICKSPFLFIKKKIAEGMRIPDILVKYLGKFRLTLGRARAVQARNLSHYTKGFVEKHEYDEVREFLDERIEDLIIEKQNRKRNDESDED